MLKLFLENTLKNITYNESEISNEITQNNHFGYYSDFLVLFCIYSFYEVKVVWYIHICVQRQYLSFEI